MYTGQIVGTLSNNTNTNTNNHINNNDPQYLDTTVTISMYIYNDSHNNDTNNNDNHSIVCRAEDNDVGLWVKNFCERESIVTKFESPVTRAREHIRDQGDPGSITSESNPLGK